MVGLAIGKLIFNSESSRLIGSLCNLVLIQLLFHFYKKCETPYVYLAELVAKLGINMDITRISGKYSYM